MPELVRPPRRPARRWRIRRPLPYWAAAVALAAATALVVASLAGDAADARARWAPGDPVLVLRRDVDAGTPLGAGDVVTRSLPALAVPEGALRELPGAAVASVALHAGEVLLADRVVGPSTVAGRLPPGTRGIAVPDEGALPLRPGDRVDVLATFDPEVAGDTPTFAVARGALVVHVGAEAVTLAVGEAAAPRVAYALDAGAVRLVLSGASSRR